MVNKELIELGVQLASTLLAFLALVVSVVGLWYLKKYTDAAVSQVRSSVLPVIVVKVNVDDKTTIVAKNIGCGPALNCYWRVMSNGQPVLSGKFPYISRDEKVPLHFTSDESSKILTVEDMLESDYDEIQLIFDSALGTGYFRRFEFQPESGPDGRPMFYRFAEDNPGYDRLKWEE